LSIASQTFADRAIEAGVNADSHKKLIKLTKIDSD